MIGRLPEEVWNSLPQGWLSREEAEFLYEHAWLTTGDILEVGSHRGRSTVLLASLGRIVHAVDPWSGFDSDDPDGEKTFREFADNLVERGITNVKPVRLHVEEWQPQPCGFCYLDGDHCYQGTLEQIETAMLCNPQAVAIHDVNDSGEGMKVKRAAVELLGQWGDRVERLAVWRLR